MGLSISIRCRQSNTVITLKSFKLLRSSYALLVFMFYIVHFMLNKYITSPLLIKMLKAFKKVTIKCTIHVFANPCTSLHIVTGTTVIKFLKVSTLKLCSSYLF